MNTLLHTIIFAVTVAFSCQSLALHITQIHPNMSFGHGTVHLFVLSNGDFVEAQEATFDLTNPNAVGPAETSADNWKVGEEVQFVNAIEIDHVYTVDHVYRLQEKEVSLIVNKDRSNAYLKSVGYTESPLSAWPAGVVEDIGFSRPETNGKINWVATNSESLLVGHPSLKLEDWRKGDRIRFRRYETFYNDCWMLYNERMGIYAYPFWKVSSRPWSPASYELLSITEKDNNTTLHFDHILDLVVPTQNLTDKANKPIFRVGDFVAIKVNRRIGNLGYGISAVNPGTGEEVMARAAKTNRGFGYPGYWKPSKLDADASFTMTDYPFRIKLKNAADHAFIDKFRSVVVAVNAENNGLVLLNGDEFWINSRNKGAAENHQYTFFPVDNARWNTGELTSRFYQEIFPNLPTKGSNSNNVWNSAL